MKNKKFNYIILFIFTALVLYFSLKDDYELVISYILKMNPLWFIYSLILLIIYLLFKAFITRRYVKFYNKEYSLLKAFKLRLETMFFDGITPFSSGGGGYQLISLRKDNVRIVNGANVMVISSFLHQLTLFTFMTISVIVNLYLNLYPESITVRNLSIFGYIVVVIVMLFLLLVMFSEKFNGKIVNLVIKILNKMKIVKNKEETIAKWHNYIDSLNEGSKLIRSDRKNFIICYIYNMLAMLSYVLIPYTVARGMGIYSFNIIQTIVTTSYVLMLGMFVPIPGGTGGLEYAFSNLYSNFIVGSSVNAVMLVWRFITYYLGIIAGGIALNIRKAK